MDIYNGVSYFAESPYARIEKKGKQNNSMSLSKDDHYKMNMYKYSKSNAMFAKPVQKEEIALAMRQSAICSKYKSLDRKYACPNAGRNLKSISLISDLVA